jgi:hypothetical protein
VRFHKASSRATRPGLWPLPLDSTEDSELSGQSCLKGQDQAGRNNLTAFHSNFTMDWVQWLKSVILAPWEAKIRKIVVRGQPRQKVHKTPSQPMSGHSGKC